MQTGTGGAMTMPGFTAEVSLYRTSAHYYQVGEPLGQSQWAASPAQSDDCFRRCFDSCREAGGIALQCSAECRETCGEPFCSGCRILPGASSGF
jgi:hypothetical protein